MIQIMLGMAYFGLFWRNLCGSCGAHGGFTHKKTALGTRFRTTAGGDCGLVRDLEAHQETQHNP